MQLLTDWHSFPTALRGGVLSIGNFDGVHAGHAKMLSTAKSEAQRRGCSFAIMTFDPHPAAILHPERPRTPLTTFEQRRELLSAFTPDVLLIIPTTREFLAIAPEGFLKTVVEDTLGARELVEGRTFTYGKGARGTVQTLRQSAAGHHFEALILPTQQATLADGTPVKVSSSLIRSLVQEGRVSDAAICLGRPYALRGEVVRGQQRGKALGFPTANILPEQLLPSPGIYAGLAKLADASTFQAAISIGTNPTFAGHATTVEAFLLDYGGDLYGQTIELQFHHWLRAMLAFPDAGTLAAQMQRDVEQARQLMTVG